MTPSDHSGARMAVRPVAQVLHLGKYYPPEPGGVEQVVRSLIEATRGELTHWALLAARSGPSRIEEIPGVRLHFLRQHGTFLLAPYLPTLPLILHRLRRDVSVPLILLHAPNPFATVALAQSLALRHKRERLVVWYHADVLFDRLWKRVIYALYQPFERYVFRRADAFVAATPHHIRSSATLRRYEERVRVIPFAVDDRWFERGPSRLALAREVRDRIGGPFVLFVGRLAAYKGLDTLLDAASAIDSRIVLIGTGPLEKNLRQRISELRLEEKILLTGHVDDLRPWYAACELLVLPSSSALEAFGLVQLEAMAAGKPVVSSDLPTGVTWVNRDGETGSTFPVGDAGALAAACNRLLGDPSLRRRLGEYARERARREFSSSALGERMVALVRDLVGEPAG